MAKPSLFEWFVGSKISYLACIFPAFFEFPMSYEFTTSFVRMTRSQKIRLDSIMRTHRWMRILFQLGVRSVQRWEHFCSWTCLGFKISMRNGGAWPHAWPEHQKGSQQDSCRSVSPGLWRLLPRAFGHRQDPLGRSWLGFAKLELVHA